MVNAGHAKKNNHLKAELMLKLLFTIIVKLFLQMRAKKSDFNLTGIMSELWIWWSNLGLTTLTSLSNHRQRIMVRKMVFVLWI